MFQKVGLSILAVLEAIKNNPLFAAAALIAAFIGGLAAFTDDVGKLYELAAKTLCRGCPSVETCVAAGDNDLFKVRFDRSIEPSMGLFRVHEGVLLAQTSALGVLMGSTEPLKPHELLSLKALSDAEIASEVKSGRILRRVDLAELARAVPVAEQPPALIDGMNAEIIRRLGAMPITDCDAVSRAAPLVDLLRARPLDTPEIATRAEIELLRFTYQCPA